MLDANERAECRTEEMTEITQECRLVDTHLIADLYSDVETYARGKGKINFILMTPTVQQVHTSGAAY